MPSYPNSLRRLRSGETPWRWQGAPAERDFPAHLSCDVVIVGAGITGACLAERLTRRGLAVLVIDRHAPERASTAASTALLLWELDAPMRELEDRLGFARAARIYQRMRQGVADLAHVVAAFAIPCDFAARDSLYLAGDMLDAAALREEGALRRAAGLGGAWLDEGAVMGRGFRAAAALHHDGAAEADPVALAAGLMRLAQQRGAGLLSPLTAVAYDASAAGFALATERGGQIEARALILASGYEMPPFVPAPSHRLLSTWAIGTAPLPAEKLWPGRALVWEASEPYLYIRTTAEGRVIAGGADEEIADSTRREALTPAKGEELRAKLVARCGDGADAPLDYLWSGLFGVTGDGLPLIGPVPGMAGCYAAFGYGGNGIVFAQLAAEMIDDALAGRRHPLADDFALDRAM